MNRALAAFVSAFLICTSAFADIEYTYDEIGRLVGVYAPSGDAAQYVYDPAGNITAINRFTATQLSVIEFTPNSGPVGTVVTIWGTGFSATPSSNTVTFNGTGATVSTATVNKLTVTVPTGATTGLITVTVASNNAQSATNFTVTAAGGAPTITTFSPVTGAPGDTVTISGTNFDTTPAQNDVNFNLTFANPSAATSTSITTTVPSNTASGKIQVRTASGTAVSANDFLIPYGTHVASDMLSSAWATVDGTPASLSISTANKVGVVLFDGTQGQRIGISIAPTTSPAGGSVVVDVLRPDNVVFIPQTSATSSGLTLDLPVLPLTGTYAIGIVADASHTVTATVTVSTDVAAAAGTPGTITNVTIARAGQNGRLTFAGTTGQQVGVYLHNISSNLQGSRVDLISPWNQVLGTANSQGTSASIDAKTLPSTGTYTILVTPQTIGTGTFSVQYGVPDLAITSFTPGTPYANQGGRYFLPFTATIVNQGTVGIKGVQRWTDQTYLSTNSTLDTSDVMIGSYQNGDLASGASYSIDLNPVTPSGTTPGTYTYFLKTDTNNISANYTAGEYYIDSNLANNVASAQITIAGLPDLTVSNLVVGTITVNGNGSYRIPVTFTVTNSGPGGAKAAWYDTCFLSANGTLDTSDWNLGATLRNADLAASASYNVSMNCTTPTTTTPGGYTLFVKTDASDPDMYMGYQYLTEGSETNNTASTAITLPTK